jgi:hypothetical protein
MVMAAATSRIIITTLPSSANKAAVGVAGGAAVARCFGSTTSTWMPIKAGTVLTPLGVFKGQDPPMVKEREEYPAWFGSLAVPSPSLALLRKIPNDEANEKEILRFLKLSRRLQIRQRNEESAK